MSKIEEYEKVESYAQNDVVLIDGSMGTRIVDISKIGSGSGTKADKVIETVSGPVATFSDGAADKPVQSLIASILPVQEGTGDPSPENVRPISGWTECKIKHAGYVPGEYIELNHTFVQTDVMFNSDDLVIKCEFKYDDFVRYSNIFSHYVSETADTTRIVNGSTEGQMLFTLNNKVNLGYYGKKNIVHGVWHTAEIGYGYGIFDETRVDYTPMHGSTPLTSGAVGCGDSRTTVCLKYLDAYKGNELYASFIPCTDASGVAGLYEIVRQKFYPASASESATVYGTPDDAHRDISTEYDVAFPTSAGTVYGGTLNVTTGELTVDWVKYTVPNLGSEWTREANGHSDQTNMYWCAIANRNAPTGFANTPGSGDGNGLFSHGVWQYDALPNNVWRAYCRDYNGPHPSFVLIDPSTNFNSDSVVNEYLENLSEPIQLAYKLATPITYHCAPTEVRTLLGSNAIFADTGDVTVEYAADTKTYIDDQIAALVATLSTL